MKTAYVEKQNYLLEESKPFVLIINFPDLSKTTDLNTANNYHHDEPSHHDGGLEHVCPYYSF